jgi:hypothetical protein
MPKFKTKVKIDGKEQEVEVELSNEDIVKAQGQDKSLFMDLAQAQGIDFEDGKNEPKNEKKGDSMDLKELRKMIKEEVSEAVKPVSESVKKITDDVDAKNKDSQSKKISSLMDKAISEGKIAKGDAEKFQKDFSSPEQLENALKYIKPDPNIASGTPKNSGNSSADEKSDGKGGAGGGVFTEEQIQNMSTEEFAKNETAIMQAMEKGTIITN